MWYPNLCICYDEESIEGETEDLSFKLLFTLMDVMQLNPMKMCPYATIKDEDFKFCIFHVLCNLAHMSHIWAKLCGIASIFFIFSALAPNLGWQSSLELI